MRFRIDPTNTFTHRDGAVEYRTAMPFCTVNCTGYADTAFTVPACIRVGSKTVSGFLTMKEECPMFVADKSGANAGLVRWEK